MGLATQIRALSARALVDYLGIDATIGVIVTGPGDRFALFRVVSVGPLEFASNSASSIVSEPEGVLDGKAVVFSRDYSAPSPTPVVAT